MKKLIIIISIIAVFLVGGLFLSRQLAQRQISALMADLETEAIQQGVLSSAVEATGTARANQSAYLIWKTAGKVDQVFVQVGDWVSTGEMIATLDPGSLPSFVILAQADLVNTEKQLDDLLTSSVQQASARKAVEEAEKALEDARNPGVAQAEAQIAIAAAEADLDAAEKQLAILTKPVSQAAIDQAYANLLLAEKQLNELQDRITKTEGKLNGPYNDFWESPKYYRTILEALNMQLPQLQLRFERATNKYNNLLSPPDPLDVAVAEAAVFAAQAQLDNARLQYERIKDGATPAEIAVLEAQLADAQREYERVRDGAPVEDIAILEAQIAASQATLEQTTIEVPFDGMITMVETLPGDQVNAGSLAFRMDDLSKILVDANVSEIDINLIRPGQNVVVTFDGILAKEYQGEVVEVASIGENNMGVTSFKVTVEVLDADQEVRPGMTAEVKVITSEVENALLVPNRAIRLLDGERVVYVIRENEILSGPQQAQNSIVPVPIRLGESSDLYSEVLDGDLEVGDQVILNPPSDGIGDSRGGGILVEIHP